MLNAVAKRKGIPEKFVGGIMTNELSQDKLLFIAGLMEQQGASFEEQVLAVLEHVERYWSNMDLIDKNNFRAGT